jgi:hypothetical protein
MTSDPIVAQLHRIRVQHAREFGYDLREMFQDLRKQQENSGLKVVRLRSRGTAQARRKKRSGARV